MSSSSDACASTTTSDAHASTSTSSAHISSADRAGALRSLLRRDRRDRTPLPGASRVAVLQIVLAGVLWGTGGITGQLLATATGLGGPAIAAYRLGLGGLALVVYCLFRRARMPRRRKAWRHVASLGVLAAIFQAAYFSALHIGSVSVATLVAIGSAPLVVLVVDRVRGARPTAAQVRAACLGVVGLALLVGAPEGGRSTASTVGCAGLALVAGGAFAGFTMEGRRTPADLDPQASVGVGFVIGGALLAVSVTVTDRMTGAGGLAVTLDARSLTLLAALALIPTAAAYALFFRGLQGASASTAVVIALLEPTTATTLSVLLLHETITIVGLAGAVLLLVSVADAARSETTHAGRPGRRTRS